MPDNPNQPREYDAVLGGQAPPPIDGLVLGGIEGVKRCLDSNSQEIKIAALSDALKYGREGQELLNQIVLTETGVLQWVAYDLLFQSSTEDEKQNLLQHIPLQSEAGVDYSNLRNLLASGEWLQANLETNEKIQEAVGKKSQTYFHYLDLIDLSQTDLRTIDQLWVKFSNNHFGYSVQKRILLEKGWLFDEKRNHLSHLYKPNLKDRKDRVFDIYKQFGWIASTFESSQFTFEASPMGSLPMIPGKEIRRRWYYQIPLIIRSDL
ncbi:GUN4 domain-containing protein [Nostoc piscinale]|uniref:GUN4 domain-containing protein n=1 Tax=Nostoc piscinale TaxID=224012 RepID=UPI0007847A02|nr:GUN4 domain-containing protein [Nostoc piscinale]